MKLRLRTMEDLVEEYGENFENCPIITLSDEEKRFISVNPFQCGKEVDIFFWRGYAVMGVDRNNIEMCDIIYPEMIDKRDRKRFVKWLRKQEKKPAIVLIKNINIDNFRTGYMLVKMKPKQIKKSLNRKKLGKIYKYIKISYSVKDDEDELNYRYEAGLTDNLS